MKLSAGKRQMLREGARRGFIEAYMQRRRPVEAMALLGLFSKSGFNTYRITALGRAEASKLRRTRGAKRKS